MGTLKLSLTYHHFSSFLPLWLHEFSTGFIFFPLEFIQQDKPQDRFLTTAKAVQNLRLPSEENVPRCFE